MATFMVSFRIEEILDSELRRAMLCAEIERISKRHWKNNTSFYVIESEASTLEIAENLKAIINPDHDIVLVRSFETRTAFVAGMVDDDLFVLMPYCKKA